MKKGLGGEVFSFSGVVLLPLRVSSLTFHLEQPAGATEPCGRLLLLGVGELSQVHAVAARSTGAASALDVGAISVEGVSQENADAQN